MGVRFEDKRTFSRKPVSPVSPKRRSDLGVGRPFRYPFRRGSG